MANHDVRGPVAIIVTLLLLLGGYIASYYALVDRNYAGTNWVNIHPEPQYRYVHSTVSKAIYRPMHELDKRVRTEYWAGFDATDSFIY